MPAAIATGGSGGSRRANGGHRMAAEAFEDLHPSLGPLIKRDKEGWKGRALEGGEGNKEGTTGLLGGHCGHQMTEKAPPKLLLRNRAVIHQLHYSSLFFKKINEQGPCPYFSGAH